MHIAVRPRRPATPSRTRSDALAVAESQLEAGWDAVANTIHDALLGFVDLARAREARLEDRSATLRHTSTSRSTDSRARVPSRPDPHRRRGREITESSERAALARLLLDNALGSIDSGARSNPRRRDLSATKADNNGGKPALPGIGPQWQNEPMPGTPQHMFILRLALATMLALYVPWVLGPEDMTYRMFAVSLALLTVLGGTLRNTTKEGGLTGEMATAAMALLLLAPAVGIRGSRVGDAIFTANHIAPHEALFQLPAIAQTVPLASGPLLVGAGLAIIAICGRLGAVYAGIAFGAATAAWVGQTLAVEAEAAMLAERFEGRRPLQPGNALCRTHGLGGCCGRLSLLPAR